MPGNKPTRWDPDLADRSAFNPQAQGGDGAAHLMQEQAAGYPSATGHWPWGAACARLRQRPPRCLQALAVRCALRDSTPEPAVVGCGVGAQLTRAYPIAAM